MPSEIKGSSNFDSDSAGKVLQVVSNYNALSGHIETTSTSDVASGISVTITPKSTSSKIHVSFNTTMVDSTGGYMSARMFINGVVETGAGNYHMLYQESVHARYSPGVFNGVYDVVGAGSITFEPYFRSHTGANARLVHGGASYNLTVTEIAQ
jgi:hypothetical protein